MGPIEKAGEYLLFTSPDIDPAQDGRSGFPIRLEIVKFGRDQKPGGGSVSEEEARTIIEQARSLSLLYWRTVRRQNLPVTAKYPELIAEHVRHFALCTIPHFSKGCMWFV